MLLWGELQTDAINSNFENFESTHYMKSVSMPLTGHYMQKLTGVPVGLDSNMLPKLGLKNFWHVSLEIGKETVEGREGHPQQIKSIILPSVFGSREE